MLFLRKGRGGFFCFFLMMLASLQIGAASTPSEYEFFGVHLMANYYECSSEAIKNIERLKEVLLEAAQFSGAHVCSSSEEVFPPYGFTMLITLSESHASIHTYPEYNACFIDFFTCGHKCSAEKFDSYVREYLSPGRVVAKTFTRGEEGIEERKKAY